MRFISSKLKRINFFGLTKNWQQWVFVVGNATKKAQNTIRSCTFCVHNSRHLVVAQIRQDTVQLQIKLIQLAYLTQKI